MLKDSANTWKARRTGILAYYDHRISGPLEDANNVIKTLQRQVYGFQDKNFFIHKVYALHTTGYELVGSDTIT